MSSTLHKQASAGKATQPADQSTQSRTDADRQPAAAPRARIPFGVPTIRTKVGVEIPGFEVRWVNDLDGHIERALQGGYQFVTRTEVSLPPSLDVFSTNSDLGERVSQIAGTFKSGQPYRMYLMKIPIEFKDEDRNILRNMRAERLRSIKQGRATSTDSNFYVPDHTPIRISSKSPTS